MRQTSCVRSPCHSYSVERKAEVERIPKDLTRPTECSTVALMLLRVLPASWCFGTTKREGQSAYPQSPRSLSPGSSSSLSSASTIEASHAPPGYGELQWRIKPVRMWVKSTYLMAACFFLGAQNLALWTRERFGGSSIETSKPSTMQEGLIRSHPSKRRPNDNWGV